MSAPLASAVWLWLQAIVTLEQPAAMKRDRTRQLVLDILCTVAVGHKLVRACRHVVSRDDTLNHVGLKMNAGRGGLT